MAGNNNNDRNNNREDYTSQQAGYSKSSSSTNHLLNNDNEDGQSPAGSGSTKASTGHTHSVDSVSNSISTQQWSQWSQSQWAYLPSDPLLNSQQNIQNMMDNNLNGGGKQQQTTSQQNYSLDIQDGGADQQQYQSYSALQKFKQSQQQLQHMQQSHQNQMDNYNNRGSQQISLGKLLTWPQNQTGLQNHKNSYVSHKSGRNSNFSSMKNGHNNQKYGDLPAGKASLVITDVSLIGDDDSTVKDLFNKGKDGHGDDGNGNSNNKVALNNPVQTWYQKLFTKDLLTKLAIFAFFVAADTSKIIVQALTVKGTQVNSQTLTTGVSVISIFIGISLAWIFNGIQQGVLECLDWHKILVAMPSALFFATSQAFNIMQYVFLSPGTGKVMSQFRLPLMTFGSRFILKKTYSGRQWMAILMVALSASIFMISKRLGYMTATDDGSEKGEAFGMACGLMAACCSVMGTLISEKIMKKDKETPFYIQKFHLEISNAAVCVILLFLLPYFGAFVDWVHPGDQVALRQSIFTYKAKFQCVSNTSKNIKNLYKQADDLPPQSELSKEIQASMSDSSMTSYDDRQNLPHVMQLNDLAMQSFKVRNIAAKSPYKEKLHLALPEDFNSYVSLSGVNSQLLKSNLRGVYVKKENATVNGEPAFCRGGPDEKEEVVEIAESRVKAYEADQELPDTFMGAEYGLEGGMDQVGDVQTSSSVGGSGGDDVPTVQEEILDEAQMFTGPGHQKVLEESEQGRETQSRKLLAKDGTNTNPVKKAKTLTEEHCWIKVQQPHNDSPQYSLYSFPKGYDLTGDLQMTPQTLTNETKAVRIIDHVEGPESEGTFGSLDITYGKFQFVNTEQEQSKFQQPTLLDNTLNNNSQQNPNQRQLLEAIATTTPAKITNPDDMYVMRGMYAPGLEGPTKDCQLICDPTICTPDMTLGYPYIKSVEYSGIVRGYENGYFAGWGWMAIIAMSNIMICFWAAGILVKHLSAVYKNIAQCATMLLCFFLGDFWILYNPEKKLSTLGLIATIIAGFLIVLSIMMFATSSDSDKDKEKAAKEQELKEKLLDEADQDGDMELENGANSGKGNNSKFSRNMNSQVSVSAESTSTDRIRGEFLKQTDLESGQRSPNLGPSNSNSNYNTNQIELQNVTNNGASRK